MYPLVLFIIALVAAAAHLLLSKKKATFPETVKVLLGYLLPINVGVASILGFVAHFFYGPRTASLIGWPPHNPFQTEIAMANLGLGIIGLLTIWYKRGFWLATTLAYVTFFWGAAYVHFTQMAKGNYAPYNSGIFLYVGDIFIPLVILILALIHTVHNKNFRCTAP